ncbi:MAG: PsbP-related protein [Acidimicrobiales bacterium]
MTRIAKLACLLGAVVLGVACSSGSNTPNTQGSATSRPAAPTPGSTLPGSRACASATTPGAPGGGDVLVPGDIPDNQAYVTYQSTTGGYHLSVPEGWARTTVGDAVTFSDKFNSIRVQITSAPSAPTLASAQSTDQATLAASTPCFHVGTITIVGRKAGSAIRITYRGDSPADSVTGKVVQLDVERYEFWQTGKLATITVSSPRGSDNVDPWRRVTDSFAWGM